MKTAVVTGITGCIGRHVSEQLLLEGWRVVGLGREECDSVDTIISYIPDGCDAVFHCGGSTSGDFQKDNNLLTTSVMVASAIRNVGRIIFTSTTATHEHPDKQGEYAYSKWLCEQMVLGSGLDAVVLQPCVVIGRYDTKHYSKLFDWTDLVFPGSMEFCWAEDVAKAHVLAYERGKPGESYVIAGDYQPWLAFFREVAELLGRKKPTKPTTKAYLYGLSYAMKLASVFTRKPPLLTPATIKLITSGLPCPKELRQKTIDDLGYDPKTPLKHMINDCYDWLKAEGRL